jgi:hypothetical protein
VHAGQIDQRLAGARGIGVLAEPDQALLVQPARHFVVAEPPGGDANSCYGSTSSLERCFARGVQEWLHQIAHLNVDAADVHVPPDRAANSQAKLSQLRVADAFRQPQERRADVRPFTIEDFQPAHLIRAKQLDRRRLDKAAVELGVTSPDDVHFVGCVQRIRRVGANRLEHRKAWLANRFVLLEQASVDQRRQPIQHGRPMRVEDGVRTFHGEAADEHTPSRRKASVRQA